MTTSQHQHREAYCLMLYRSDDGTEEEWIWNSRDGVTPFVVTLRSGKEARHVEWHRDRCLPDHQPRPGDRIFVDLTPERAFEKRRAFVDRWWDDPEMPMSQHPFLGPMGKDGAARQLALGDLDPFHGLPKSMRPADAPTEYSGTPDLIEVPLCICRDEDCPKCGWWETYSEVALDLSALVAVGCRKCGWREAAA